MSGLDELQPIAAYEADIRMPIGQVVKFKPARKRRASAATPETEDAVALSFEVAGADRFLWNATRKQWLVKDGHTWRLDIKNEVVNAIRLHVRETAPESMHKARAISSIEALCKVSPAFARVQEDLDRDKFLLGTPKGVIDLRT